jgi:hypothetical protein
MISGLLEPIGVDPTDVVSHRRILAFITGGLIPFISLTFAHMLIVYSSKIQTNEDNVEPVNDTVNDTVSDTVNEPVVLTEEVIEQLSTDAGKIEFETVEEKINPTPEEISRLEEALILLETKNSENTILEEVINEPEIEEPVETQETTKYFVDDEEVVEEKESTGLPEELQEKIKRLSYTKNV